MQNGQDEEKKRQKTFSSTYFSEYQTHESSYNNQTYKKNQSANMMRKLKQLWNRQRYLTDDQYESSKDVKGSCFLEDPFMDYQVDESIKSFSHGKLANCKNSQAKKSQHVRKHQRVASSSDQQLNLPQKMKKTKDSKLQIKSIQNLCMNGQAQQLASISSAFQDQFQQKVNR